MQLLPFMAEEETVILLEPNRRSICSVQRLLAVLLPSHIRNDSSFLLLLNPLYNLFLEIKILKSALCVDHTQISGILLLHE